MQSGTIYVKKMPPKEVKGKKGRTKFVEENGQDVLNRIISYVESFICKNRTKESLEEYIGITREEELEEINNDLTNFYNGLMNKHYDKTFDTKKHAIMRSKHMFAINYRPEQVYDGADYPSTIQIPQDLYDKIIETNENAIDNGCILGMQVVVADVERRHKKGRNYERRIFEK